MPTPGQVLAARGQFSDRSTSPLWRPATIRRFLIHPAYVGRHIAYRWQITQLRERDTTTGILRYVNKRVERAADDEERIPLPAEVCPPLVDEATALAVQARLINNRAESVRHHQDPEATLLRSGYIFCGHCGRKMYTHRPGGEWRYTCNTFRLTPEMPQCLGKGVSITAFIIDPIVWGHVRQVLLNPQHIAQALERWRVDHEQQDGRATAHLTAVEGQLARLQVKAANLTAGVAEAGSVEARTVLLSTLDQVSKDIAILSTERESLLQDAA